MDNPFQRQRIHRAPHNKQNPFVIVSRSTAVDEYLGHRAFHILVWALAQPDTWQIRVEDLQRRGFGGANGIRESLAELELAGYLQRFKKRGRRGEWIWEHHIYETPHTFGNPTAPPPGNREPGDIGINDPSKKQGTRVRNEFLVEKSATPVEFSAPIAVDGGHDAIDIEVDDGVQALFDQDPEFRAAAVPLLVEYGMRSGPEALDALGKMLDPSLPPGALLKIITSVTKDASEAIE